MENKEKKNRDKEITRKEAIKKAGKYAALTAASMFFVLNPLKSQITSAPSDPTAW